LDSKLRYERAGYCFFLVYALLYMSNAVFGTFLPVYLDHVGFSSTAVGSILSLGPFVTILAQPIWGTAGDRAKSKNNVLKLLVLGSAVSVAMFYFSSNYYYLLAVMAAVTFFQSSISPLNDAITLEYIEKTRWKFSSIRMAGTIGYAFMSIFAGAYAKKNIDGIFGLYILIAMLLFGAIFLLPRVQGHQSQGKKVSLLVVFKNYELVLLLAYSTILQVTLQFYYSFFGIYFKGMGGDNGLLGWAMFLSAIIEIPFLLFANRIINKIGTRYALVLSGCAMAVRWVLLHFITAPMWVLPVQLLHSLSFIVISYSMATYINEKVPKELKASGQAMFGFLSFGAARIVSTLLGGYLSDRFGIRNIFLCNSGLIVISTILFLLFFHPAVKNSVVKHSFTSDIE
jgi:PPP family 3-phenylpropionic acid transporter